MVNTHEEMQKTISLTNKNFLFSDNKMQFPDILLLKLANTLILTPKT